MKRWVASNCHFLRNESSPSSVVSSGVPKVAKFHVAKVGKGTGCHLLVGSDLRIHFSVVCAVCVWFGGGRCRNWGGCILHGHRRLERWESGILAGSCPLR